ncbi:alkaline shock response membrane anchor protein AmaP [Streptomyces sp. PA5.6]|uniref:alkaline shock response membrane anchor protein AmaP n=1 Tax=Streptomyces sp. PA5.6 TaxID=3035651 RepID=UPI003904B460
MSGLRTGVNRTALLCIGAALLGAGAVLATTTDVVRDRLPSDVPRLGADRVWVDGAQLGRWRDQGLWTPAVIAGLSVGVLLLLWWAWTQVRGGRLRELPLGQPDVTLSGAALAAAMTERARGIEGVAHARVRLRGGARQRLRTGPRGVRARITLALSPDASPEAVLRCLARQTVAEARAAVSPRPLVADVRLTGGRGRDNPARRVSVR